MLTEVATQVKTTMKRIKHTLTERHYVWEDAYRLAKQDPEINLSGEGEAYSPLDGEDVLVNDAGWQELSETRTATKPAQS